MEAPDEVLAERVAAGDRDAFALLYDRYAQRIYAWSAHLLGSDRADDLIQDVFLTLWARAGQYDQRRGPFAVWFMAVARHRIQRELRRAGLRQRFRAAIEVDEVLARTASKDPEPSEQAGDRETGAELAAALRLLPAEQRQVLVMAYFGGLSQSEIARRLTVPLGTVKKRVRLGMRKLRGALAADGDPDQRSRASQ